MTVKPPKFLVIRADREPMGEFSYFGADDIGEAEDIADDYGSDIGTADNPIDFLVLESQGWKEARILTVPMPVPDDEGDDE